MKKIVKSFSFFAVAFATLLVSCSEEFLQKVPESSLVSGTIKSSQDAENLLTGAYNELIQQSFYQYDHFQTTDGLSDNCYINGDAVVAEQPIENFTFDSSTSVIQAIWQYLYAHITGANAVFDNVPAVNDPKWTGTNRKEQILGEASFLRGLAYYWLVTQWGDVPLILTNNSDFYPSRSSKTQVYDQIIKDLKYAESVLPVTPYKGEYGRATKGAAQALLAKTYAEMGDYTNCLIYCNNVINSNTYSLVTDYSKLWGASHKNTSESIFEIQNPTNGFWGVQIFAYVESDGWPKRNIGSYDLVQAFNAAGDNGVRYKSTFNWQVTNASFNMPLNAWDSTKPIPFMNKLPDPNGYASTDNITVMRLADIILLAAEANVQLGDNAAAITQLNQIRTRAGLPNTTANTKSALALAVLNERRLELVFECTRWNDLKRADVNGTINLVTLMNSQVDSNGKNLNFNLSADKHQFVYPIPFQDRQLNKNLTQNPGYSN